MFSDYLKRVRLSLGLTQSEVALKLNLADDEFRSIDTVTISRWERGKTKPTLSKCLRILGCLKIDLSDFYDLLPNPNENSLFNEYFRLRFDSALVKLSSSNYEGAIKPKSPLIIERPLLSEDNDEILFSLKAFFGNVNYVPKGLFDISLYEYQQNQRAICKRFTNENEQLLGHSISFIFRHDYFNTKNNPKKIDLDLKKSVRYTKSAPLAVCNYSRYSSNSDVFRNMLASQIINLIKHSNVQRYYFLTHVSEGEEYLDRLGFSKVSFDIESGSGKFMLGTRSFERCLFGIDSSKLISHPEIITLIKTTQQERSHRINFR